MYKQYFKNSRLSKNLVSLSLVLLMLIIISLITVKLLNKIESYAKNNIKNSLETILKTTQGALHVWAQFQIDDIAELSADPEFIALTKKIISDNTLAQLDVIKDVKNKPSDKKSLILEKINTFLLPYLRLRSHESFLLVSRKRKIIASLRSDLIGRNIVFTPDREPFIQRALKGEIVLIPPTKLDPKKDTPRFKNAAFFIISPIKDQTNKVIALLTFEINPWEQFTKITQLGRIGNSGETYAFNNNGLLISQSRFDKQLKKIGLVSKGSTSLLSIKITDPKVNLLQGSVNHINASPLSLTLMAQSAITNGAGTNTEGYNDYRGVKVFGAWLWDDFLDFGLTTEIDAAEALIPFNSARNIILLSLVIISVLFISFVLFVIRSYIKEQLFLKQENERNEILVTSRTKELLIAKENLEQVNIELTNLVKIDALTQLANRRYFDEHLDQEIRRCARDKKPLSLLFMDIDYFKRYNDHYGHSMGDECLQKVAQAFKSLNIEQRAGDIVCRYGGEEFTIVLSGANNSFAIKCAKKVLATITNLQLPHADTAVENINHVTLSIGIATEVPVKQMKGKSIIDKADKALYQAKNNGRNQYFNYAIESSSV